MTVSSTSRSVRSLATASSSGTSPFMGTSLLEVTMIRPGTGLHVVEGPEHGVVDPDGDHRHPIGRDTHLRRDVLARVLRHGEHRGKGACDPHLHAEEAEPATRREPLPGVRRVGQGELAVDRDGMVQRRQQGPPVFDHAEHPVAEALVVVHDVELVATLRQELPGPQTSRPGAPRSRPCT